MKTVVVSGALANKYLNAGEAWVRLSYVRGFQRLGFDTFFVEQIDDRSCFDSSGSVTDFDQSVNVAYFKEVTEAFGLSRKSALISASGEYSSGLSLQEVRDLADSADLLVNITGNLTLEPLFSKFRRKAFIDIDPGFTQFWHDAGTRRSNLEGHHFYFTIGENIGTPRCPIPTGNIHWRPTRPLVVLEDWPKANGVAPNLHGRFTTVASWRGTYGRVEHGGRQYGSKVHEFRRFVDLPQHCSGSFEIALDIHPSEVNDLALLHRNGWRLVDPRRVLPGPADFRNYVQASGAEFSVAQGIYVDTRCGWVSDRTVRYLASGKPVLVQDTGFSDRYPVGEGLLSFRTLAEAINGAECIARDYASHCQAARLLAETWFDSDKVLGSLLDEVGLKP
jgi:hypothetical protein